MKILMNSLLAIAAIVTILAGIVTIIFSFSTSSPAVMAIVRGHPHHHLINWRKFNYPELGTLKKYSHFSDEFGYTQRVSGVYQILLRNNGNQAARNVSVFVDNALGMKIIKRNESKFSRGEEALIGNMRPNEEVEIISWKIGSTQIAGRHGEPRIKVTYDNGVAELDFRYEIEGYFRFLHRNNFDIILEALFFFILIPLAVAVLFVAARLTIKKLKKNGNSSRESEK